MAFSGGLRGSKYQKFPGAGPPWGGLQRPLHPDPQLNISAATLPRRYLRYFYWNVRPPKILLFQTLMVLAHGLLYYKPMQHTAITWGNFHFWTFEHISAKNHCLIVVEGSLEAHRWVCSIGDKIFHFFNCRGLGPNYHIWALRSQNTFLDISRIKIIAW